ncbi:hypothetical protein [Klebsiella aerogenes]|uniref:hypothetical protein n=1 Tax=Klebsiella aerogenes TaxID=548 RepID=UPI0020902C7F|nr:hypothetical protein [Klebsiella aerogenes]MCO4801226.1 hypothetical protein [Klebsiella aerogenes]MEB6384320.1 hypothetical protein [Klebsiella aerogenes]
MTDTDQESLKKIYEEYHSKYKKHLTPDLDMISLVLKAHLFLEEILYEIILLHCKVPEALNGIQFSFHHKLKLAEALYGVHMYKVEFPRKIWPVLDALNKLRNELAHRIDSPRLEGKIVNFLRLSEGDLMKDESLQPLNEILCDSKLLMERMLTVLWCMLGSLGFMHGVIYLNTPEKFLEQLWPKLNAKN